MESRRGETYRRRHGEGLDLRTKYAQMHTDQFDDLTPVARELQDAKRPDAPRITENTLIRVAVDLLLELEPHLHGDTEEEIRENLLRQIQTSDNRK
ncbi:hypothetical protein GCM10009602_49430 [Nocardiopsis tropica]